MQRLYENPVIGNRLYFKKYAHEPGSDATVIDMELRAGGVTPRHFHRTYDEHYECMEGELCLEIGGRLVVLGPGDRAVVPRRAVHRSYNRGAESVLFRTTITPGHPGYEQGLKIAHGLANDGLTNARGYPHKFWHMATFVALSDTNLPGWRRLLHPLLRRSARRAQADGRFARELQPYTA